MNNYDVILKRHKGSSQTNVCIFSSEEKKKAIKEMQKYVKDNGYTIKEKNGTATIADVILRERTPFGDVISEIPYIELKQRRIIK